MLSLSQTLHSLFISRIGHQMKPADSFNGDELTVANCVCRRENGFFVSEQHFTQTIPELHVRTAGCACIRLSMKAAIARIIVFGLAIPAHFEVFH